MNQLPPIPQLGLPIFSQKQQEKTEHSPKTCRKEFVWKPVGTLQFKDGVWLMSDDSITPQDTLVDTALSLVEMHAGYCVKIVTKVPPERTWQVFLADADDEPSSKRQPIVTSITMSEFSITFDGCYGPVARYRKFLIRILTDLMGFA